MPEKSSPKNQAAVTVSSARPDPAVLRFPAEVDPVTLQPTEPLRVSAGLTVVERVYEAGWREEGR